MSTFKSVDILMNGMPTGTLTEHGDETVFTYNTEATDFVASAIPLSKEPVITRGLFNIHPFFAGLLPEGITAEIIINAYRIPEDDLFAQLQATAMNAVGDITIHTQNSPPQHIKLENLNNLPREAFTAIPGMQKKISLGEFVRRKNVHLGKQEYIVKFPHPLFPNICQLEQAMTEIAHIAKVNSHRTKLIEGNIYLQRFDRKYNVNKKSMDKIHVEDSLQIANKYPRSKYSMEFIEILNEFMRLTQSPVVILQSLEQFIFNYIIGNGDFHAKNISLLFDRKSRIWTLAPAYDIVSTLAYPDLQGYKRMAIPLADEDFGNFDRTDFTVAASEFGIKPDAIHLIINRIIKTVPSWIKVLENLPDLPNNKSNITTEILQRVESLRS